MKTSNPKVHVFEFVKDAKSFYKKQSGEWCIIEDKRGWHPTAQQTMTGYNIGGQIVEPYMQPCFFVCVGSPGLIRPFETVISHKF